MREQLTTLSCIRGITSLWTTTPAQFSCCFSSLSGYTFLHGPNCFLSAVCNRFLTGRHERPEHLWNNDALFGLVVLQDGAHHTRGGAHGGVQHVHKLCLHSTQKKEFHEAPFENTRYCFPVDKKPNLCSVAGASPTAAVVASASCEAWLRQRLCSDAQLCWQRALTLSIIFLVCP